MLGNPRKVGLPLGGTALDAGSPASLTTQLSGLKPDWALPHIKQLAIHRKPLVAKARELTTALFFLSIRARRRGCSLYPRRRRLGRQAWLVPCSTHMNACSFRLCLKTPVRPSDSFYQTAQPSPSTSILFITIKSPQKSFLPVRIKSQRESLYSSSLLCLCGSLKPSRKVTMAADVSSLFR